MDRARQQFAQGAEEALRAAMQHASLILTILLVAGGIFLASVPIVGGYIPFFAGLFLRTQDIFVAALFALFWILAGRSLAAGPNPGRFGSLVTAPGRLGPVALAVLAVAISALGGWLLFGHVPFVVDEHLARFDATIIGTGAGMVPIPEAWRDYALALQPRFARITPDGWWGSEYLPGNAALQYLGGTLASPLLVGLAVLAAADLARRLLPEAPAAPLVCTLLMVSSSQLLFTGMTPFAMSAHLALNLSWLWLFLHRNWRAQAVAMPVAMLAIGLHQLVFFPLFAAPFLLEAWLTGRRAAAVVQALAVGAGVLFWSAYDTVLYAVLGTEAAAATDGAPGKGVPMLIHRVLTLVTDFSPAALGVMGMNLTRLITWQNVLILPLVLVAARGVVRTPGPWRAMLVGILLTTAAVTVLLADQGHGWGYRYLHGHLGSACLLATLGWYCLPAELRNGGAAQAVFAAGLAVSLLLLPLRAWQAVSLVAPYTSADEAISRIDADVVLIDAPQHFFAVDLVRNDPLLRNRPKRMAAVLLSDAQLERLCRDYKLARFTDADAARFGLHQLESSLTLKGLPKGCEANR